MANVDELIQYIDPERVDEFRQAYAEHERESRPRVPAAPKARESHIVTDDKPRTQSARDAFADFMRNRPRGAW